MQKGSYGAKCGASVRVAITGRRLWVVCKCRLSGSKCVASANEKYALTFVSVTFSWCAITSSKNESFLPAMVSSCHSRVKKWVYSTQLFVCNRDRLTRN